MFFQKYDTLFYYCTCIAHSSLPLISLGPTYDKSFYMRLQATSFCGHFLCFFLWWLGFEPQILHILCIVYTNFHDDHFLCFYYNYSIFFGSDFFNLFGLNNYSILIILYYGFKLGSATRTFFTI